MKIFSRFQVATCLPRNEWSTWCWKHSRRRPRHVGAWTTSASATARSDTTKLSVAELALALLGKVSLICLMMFNLYRECFDIYRKVNIILAWFTVDVRIFSQNSRSLFLKMTLQSLCERFDSNWENYVFVIICTLWKRGVIFLMPKIWKLSLY